jgi:peptide chain release factor 1
LLFRVNGRGARALFSGESGGHRWQRIPPNEKRGRVHTSTITVAVLDEPSERELRLDPGDIDERFIRGSGAGGQKRNKTSSTVVLTHAPSGIRVRVDGRNRAQNRETAMAILRARLAETRRAELQRARNAERAELVGSGMRGDKVRTIRVAHDLVIDHRTGKRTTYKRYARGEIEALK